MEYNAIITNFNFMPMVNIVPSILHFWVDIPDLARSIMLESKGTIEQLSARFGFTIEGEGSWDFTGFIGKQCKILKDQTGYRFVSFI